MRTCILGPWAGAFVLLAIYGDSTAAQAPATAAEPAVYRAVFPGVLFGAQKLALLGMNVPGCDNRQMALNVMHWLSRLID